MRLELPVGGIASARFGVAPLFELAALARRLQRGARGALAEDRWKTWRAALAEVAENDDVAFVLRLLTSRYGSAVWVSAVPSMSRTFEDDLCAATSLPDSQLANELGRYKVPATTTIDEARDQIESGLRVLWGALLDPWWDAVGAVSEHEVARVTDTLRSGGWTAVFGRICDGVSWDGEALELTGITVAEATAPGLVLVPSVFVTAGPVVRLGTDQPTVVYFPARGVGNLFGAGDGRPPGLDALLGPNRARILHILEHPTSVSRLRDLLGLSLGSISRHLSVLSGSGLVSSRRVGRTVEYELTGLGRTLAAAQLPGAE